VIEGRRKRLMPLCDQKHMASNAKPEKLYKRKFSSQHTEKLHRQDAKKSFCVSGA
jgi:hypothetical protein